MGKRIALFDELKKSKNKMNRMSKYAIEIFYSAEDEGYIAVVPELPGCSAFGASEEESLEQVKSAMELWLETARKERRKIPKPQSKEILRILCEKIEKGQRVSSPALR